MPIRLTAARSARDQGAIAQILAQIENLTGAASGAAVTLQAIETAGPRLIGSFRVPEALQFGTTLFGGYAHSATAGLLQELYPDVDFEFRVLPGQRGVDVTVPQEFANDVGYQFGEIKPLTPSGEATFMRQLQRWGLDPEKVQPITYDANGNVYYGFH